tara:strand:+ start:81 stop:704 length:624 start_codon:yes stop_codon:yes gene_type:complete
MDNTIIVDSSRHTTDMCSIGSRCNTDKAPYSKKGCDKHRKGYTAFYSIIFASMRYSNINFAELGTFNGHSLLMWSEWFTQAEIYGFEYESSYIDICKQKQIPRTKLNFIDVSSSESINNVLSSIGVTYDIIVDDSSHVIKDINLILNNAHKYLKTNGIMIIEDLDRNVKLDQFEIDETIWSFYSFVICDHKNRKCDNNDKILYLIKR